MERIFTLTFMGGAVLLMVGRMVGPPSNKEYNSFTTTSLSKSTCLKHAFIKLPALSET